MTFWIYEKHNKRNYEKWSKTQPPHIKIFKTFTKQNTSYRYANDLTMFNNTAVQVVRSHG